MQLNLSPKAKEKISVLASELRQLDNAIVVAKTGSALALAANDKDLRQAADKALASIENLKMYLEGNRPTEFETKA